jgi:hypothetical protein
MQVLDQPVARRRLGAVQLRQQGQHLGAGGVVGLPALQLAAAAVPLAQGAAQGFWGDGGHGGRFGQGHGGQDRGSRRASSAPQAAAVQWLSRTG